MTDWGDPHTLWVNLTNAGLGLVTLICLGVVAASVVRELLERARVKARRTALLDDHAFDVPGLGWTMADGGERKKKDGSESESR